MFWLESCILSLTVTMGFVLSPMYLGCVLLLLSVVSVGYLCLSVSAWAGVWTWLVYLSGILVLLLFVCSLSPSPTVTDSAWIWAFLIMSFCVSPQQIVSLDGQFPAMASFFQGSAPMLFVWVGGLLFVLIVIVSKISPYGFLLSKSWSFEWASRDLTGSTW